MRAGMEITTKIMLIMSTRLMRMMNTPTTETILMITINMIYIAAILAQVMIIITRVAIMRRIMMIQVKSMP